MKEQGVWKQIQQSQFHTPIYHLLAGQSWISHIPCELDFPHSYHSLISLTQSLMISYPLIGLFWSPSGLIQIKHFYVASHTKCSGKCYKLLAF